MKLLTDNKRDVAMTPYDPRCMAIVQRHGDFASFQAHYCPVNMVQIAQSVDRCPDAPSLVLLLMTYGTERMAKNLSLFLVAVVKQLKLDNVDFNDIKTIATLITQNETLRKLKYPYIIAFFVAVMQGEFNVYAFKPHQVMKAFKEYAGQAIRSQAMMLEEEERRKYEAEQQGRVTMNWSEFAAKRGIDEACPIEELIKDAEG